MKYSKQRDMILKTVIGNHIHPTAEDVYQIVREKHSKMSMATVYRNLNLLTELKSIKKISGFGEADRFDGDLSDHYHMICIHCGGITDLITEALADVDDDVGKETGEEILSHKIMFSGICKNCLV
jgi:Fur family peroxide stress response transcriptional regulator